MVLQRGHEVPVEIFDDKDAPEDDRETWPAQRRVVQDESSSGGSEFRPDWTAGESDGSGEEQVFAERAGRVAKMEVGEEDTGGR
eukprot:13043087-Alexandrium_andersonii.AAC.1